MRHQHTMTRDWRRTHAGEKLAVCAAWIALAYVVNDWRWQCAIVASTTVTALAWARVEWRRWCAALGAFVVFAVCAGAMLAWGRAWGAAVYEAPLRSLAASSALLLFGLTTPLDDALAVARALRVPAPMVDLAWLAARYIAQCADEFATMQRMLAVRAPARAWRLRMEASAALASSLLTRLLQRASRSEAGLLARGVDGWLTPMPQHAAVSAASIFQMLSAPALFALAWTGRAWC